MGRRLGHAIAAEIQITAELKEIGKVRLMGAPGLTLEVLSPATGEVLASGVKVEAGVAYAYAHPAGRTRARRRSTG